MNRKSFLKLAVAAFAVIKVPFVTAKADDAECGHAFSSEIFCSGEPGHDGTHSCYKEEPSSNKNETNFVCYEWNDKGETANEREQGRAFPVDFDKGRAERVKTLSFAVMDARKTLPKGTVFEIRAKNRPLKEGIVPVYGRDRKYISRRELAKEWGVAWTTTDLPQPEGFEHLNSIPKAPLFGTDIDECEPDPVLGCLIVARMVA